MHSSNSVYQVLVVDDDKTHRNFVCAVLDGDEYCVTQATCGEEALQSLRQSDYDVMLLDKRMPGMSGDEVCRRVRSELGLELLPIIMVTGDSDEENLKLSLASGANDFVRKPYTPTELVARLESAAHHKRMTDKLDSAESLLFALARMVEAKDGTTGEHCTRLAHYGVVLGRELGLGEKELDALRRGGVLHDIGKLGIPDSVLLNPGKLSADEWTVMRQHVSIGARLVGSLKSMRLTQDIVQFHHERWDGSGYPYGLKGEEIPLLARIFQTVDIYDALANERPYKRAFSTDEIVKIMREEIDKGWRDPDITELFLKILLDRPALLQIPVDLNDDLGQNLFSNIQQSGVLDWDRRR